MIASEQLDDARSRFLHQHSPTPLSPVTKSAHLTAVPLGPRAVNRQELPSRGVNRSIDSRTPLAGAPFSDYSPLKSGSSADVVTLSAPQPTARMAASTSTSSSAFMQSNMVENLSSILALQPSAAQSHTTLFGDDDDTYETNVHGTRGGGVVGRHSSLHTQPPSRTLHVASREVLPVHRSLHLSTTASFHGDGTSTTGRAASSVPLPFSTTTSTTAASMASDATTTQRAKVAADALDLLRAFRNQSDARPPPPSARDGTPRTAVPPASADGPDAVSAATFQARRQRAQQALYHNAMARQSTALTNLDLATHVYRALLRGVGTASVPPHSTITATAMPLSSSQVGNAPRETPPLSPKMKDEGALRIPASAAGTTAATTTPPGILRTTPLFAASSTTSPSARVPASSDARRSALARPATTTPAATTTRLPLTFLSSLVDAADGSTDEPELRRCSSNHTLPFVQNLTVPPCGHLDEERASSSAWTGRAGAADDADSRGGDADWLHATSPRPMPADGSPDLLVNMYIPRERVLSAGQDPTRAANLLSTVRLLRRQTEDMTLHLLHACGEMHCWSSESAPEQRDASPQKRPLPSLFRDLFVTRPVDETSQSMTEVARRLDEVCTAHPGSPAASAHAAFVHLYTTPFARHVPAPPSTSVQLDAYQRYQAMLRSATLTPRSTTAAQNNSSKEEEPPQSVVSPLAELAEKLTAVRDQRQEDGARMRALLHLPESSRGLSVADTATTGVDTRDASLRQSDRTDRDTGTNSDADEENEEEDKEDEDGASRETSPSPSPSATPTTTTTTSTTRSSRSSRSHSSAAAADPVQPPRRVVAFLTPEDAPHHHSDVTDARGRRRKPLPAALSVPSSQVASSLDEMNSPATLHRAERPAGHVGVMSSPIDFTSVLTDDHLPNARWMLGGKVSSVSPDARQRQARQYPREEEADEEADEEERRRRASPHVTEATQRDDCQKTTETQPEPVVRHKRRRHASRKLTAAAPSAARVASPDASKEGTWLKVLSDALLVEPPSPSPQEPYRVCASTTRDTSTSRLSALPFSQLELALHELRTFEQRRCAADAASSEAHPSTQEEEESAIRVAWAWVEAAARSAASADTDANAQPPPSPTEAVLATLHRQVEEALTHKRRAGHLVAADASHASSVEETHAVEMQPSGDPVVVAVNTAHANDAPRRPLPSPTHADALDEGNRREAKKRGGLHKLMAWLSCTRNS